ncbi:MAG: hypothetical protein BWY79_00721 [Actinobacteria bacterium ADurb.Bin444]|nr:MAG: hypothetical protein BWY79_00721 [Actinobacteria bacterium ADurb.Bin444]
MGSPFRPQSLARTAWAAAWVIILLTFTLVLAAGCGDGTTPTTSAPVTPPTTHKSGAGPVGEQLVASDNTPVELAQALTTKNPVVILIYVAGGSSDELVRQSLTKIAPKFPDVTFLMYNYNNPKEYGDIVGSLGVHYPPFAAFVDKGNVVRYLTTGFVDEGVLNQYVVNIRQL